MNFSNHLIKITEYPGVLIHNFSIPGKYMNSITFINTRGIMAVTGDFGNWIFTREFYPGTDEGDKVSPGYWDEKLEMYSSQKSYVYDPEETLKEINRFKRNFKTNYLIKYNEEIKEWIESLKRVCDDEHEYIYVAYREKPGCVDYEDVPIGKIREPRLQLVYEAFNNLCKALKDPKRIIS